MAQIRCPNCDTLHDLDDAFLASGKRKVRCASCRTVWQAEEPESDSIVTVALPLPDRNLANAAEVVSVTNVVMEPDVDAFSMADAPATTREAAPAALDDADPPMASAPDEDISADDLEALFADAVPADAVAAKAASSAATPAVAEDEHKEFDPESLAKAQDAAAAAAAAAASTEPGGRRSRRAPPAARPKANASAGRTGRGGVLAAMVMAASVGTIATLLLLRQETVRLFPGTAKVFDAVGMSASARGLDILDVHSQMVMEEGREMLEVTGRIINNARTAQKLPVLRLSIRAGTGNEIYVWTATADQSDLGPGETTRFHRRLASPPGESHSVMVRFVAKDDIVAAIR